MSSLKFGTSGLRGLVTDLVGEPSRLWTKAFVEHLSDDGSPPARILVGRDLRSSSPAIAADCLAAASEAGVEAIDCGEVPTPALALAAIGSRSPAIMVTGSHIPDDRNGLKFYLATGEITKADEVSIRRAADRPRAEQRAGIGKAEDQAGEVRSLDALSPFEQRYAAFFGPDALSGLTIGVYQHSTVARDLLVGAIENAGGTATPLGRARDFIPVDTEAHRDEDIRAIAEWAATGRFDAIVSADGDGDRPLIADETGAILRGDVAGLLTARFLGVDTLVTPVTSSSTIERLGVVCAVLRTPVGSPFVLEGMAKAESRGAAPVAGFEANGGFLLGSPITRNGRSIGALATRDAVLPILCVLAAINENRAKLSALVAELGAGHAAAQRLQNVPAEASGPFLDRLAGDAEWRERFLAPAGRVADLDRIDGVRIRLDDGRVIHFRASGNAPELRCYVEAATAEEAEDLLAWGLGAARDALPVA